jgi:chromosome segregation ATPase
MKFTVFIFLLPFVSVLPAQIAQQSVAEQLDEQNRLLEQIEANQRQAEFNRAEAERREARRRENEQADREWTEEERRRENEAQIARRAAVEAQAKLEKSREDLKLKELESDRNLLVKSLQAAEEEIEKFKDFRPALVDWVLDVEELAVQGDPVYKPFKARIIALKRTIPAAELEKAWLRSLESAGDAIISDLEEHLKSGSSLSESELEFVTEMTSKINEGNRLAVKFAPRLTAILKAHEAIVSKSSADRK